MKDMTDKNIIQHEAQTTSLYVMSAGAPLIAKLGEPIDNLRTLAVIFWYPNNYLSKTPQIRDCNAENEQEKTTNSPFKTILGATLCKVSKDRNLGRQ